MTNRVFVVFASVHFAASLGVFLGLYGWALAAQDSGLGGRAGSLLEGIVHFGLLQPLAHWVLQGTGLSWWTWPGLALLAALLAANSCLATGILAGLARWLGTRSGTGRLDRR